MRAELSRDEGRRHQAYRDSLGFWTIGVGHKLPLHTRNARDLQWDDRTIDHWLDIDIQTAVALNQPHLWFRALDTDPRRRALVNMRFNMGRHLDGFHSFLNLLETGAFREAAKDLKDTLWFHQVGDRAARIMEQIIHG